MFNGLLHFCRLRAIKFGASYLSFGLFGTIYFPLSCMILCRLDDRFCSNILTPIVTFLCLILIVNHFYPRLMGKFLALYWYFTITFCLPFYTSFMLFESSLLSVRWIASGFIGLFLLLLLTDSLMFVVLLFVGVFFACISYIVCHGGHFLWYATPAHSAIVLYAYVVVVIAGVFLIRRNEMVLHEAIKRRKDANISLENSTVFINSVSHEIRALTHGLHNMSQFLVDEWHSDDLKDKFSLISSVAQNSKRLSDLVINIMDFSSYRSGKAFITPKQTDLIELVNDMIEESRNLYLVDGKGDIRLLFEHPDLEEAPIEADPIRITQLLRNLYNNAIRYSDIDSKVVTAYLDRTIVFYKNDSGEPAYRFSLLSQGHGMSQFTLKELLRIFRETNRLATKIGSSGLGLAICKDIIEAHCGKIYAENNPDGVGSRISFIIPMRFLGKIQTTNTVLEEQPIQQQSISAKQTKAKVDNIPSERKRKLVVIIDDEKSCLESLRLIVESLGYDVAATEGGINGLKFLKKHAVDIDLVLLDLMMPDLYGLNILRELRFISQAVHLPIVMQTGSTDQSELHKAMAFGILGVIHKPYNREEITKLFGKIRF